MNFYYTRNDKLESYTVRSYGTYMGEIYDDGLYCVRDYVGTTTQKQMTRFFNEFCGLKTVNAYKMARDFYRKTKKRFNNVDLFYVFSVDYCRVFKNGEIIAEKYFK